MFSLTLQTRKNFEVILVEDGSTLRCDFLVEKFRDAFPLEYFFKPNAGPGPSRNFGFARARGKYFLVFDSDCILPATYFEAVDKALAEHQWDAFGGPDKAHENFTLLQRAMGYTMASVLTTGGIRGGQKRLGWFQPRSFNMGISRRVFEVTGGFAFDRYAEDIELSIRMKRAGFRVGLIPDAFVYHKRRTSLTQFFWQVYFFGKGRVLVGRKFPEEVKLTHWLPTFFTLACCVVLSTLFFSKTLFFVGISGLLLYLLAIFFHALRAGNSVPVAVLAVPSALLQLWGYGTGFLFTRFERKSG